jgi:uncharacterized protein (TIGR00730 family)
VKAVCVFCGSSVGKREIYSEVAHALGTEIAKRGLAVVYGGSQVGLMRVVADACLEAGGKSYGVIPEAMMGKEIAHENLTELHVVKSMHERKALMADLSDGFIALPGGLGTFEEFFEVYTWGQLGYHSKPYGLLNVANYFDPLISLLDHAVTEGFVREAHRDFLQTSESPAELLDFLDDFVPQPVSKWGGDKR